MSDPMVDYEWDFEDSPPRNEGWEEDDDDEGGGDDDDDDKPTQPWEEEEEEEDEQEDEPAWAPKNNRTRDVRFAEGPLDTLDG